MQSFGVLIGVLHFGRWPLTHPAPYLLHYLSSVFRRA